MRAELSQWVNAHDTDYTGFARPSALMRFLQDAANEQMRLFGMDANRLLAEQGRAFLLSSAHIKLYRRPAPYESVLCEAWACESRGFRFLRNGRLRCGSETIAEMSSVWAFVQATDRTLLPVSAFENPFGTEPALPMGFPLRLAEPKELSLQSLGTYTVSYRDVDLHCHMNNTYYPDLLCGFLPKQQGIPREIFLFYDNEAPLGATLTVYGAPTVTEEGTPLWYFKTIRPDGKTNLRCTMLF